VSERLALYGVQKLAQPALEWAHATEHARPGVEVEQIAHELRAQSAQIARIDGAISGTPFFVALVPGYLNYLWQETRMTLRLAALYGRDPRDLKTSAELLKLRGVHPTVDAAEAALRAVDESTEPSKPEGRRPLKVWYSSVRRLLVFGGFLSMPRDEEAQTRFIRLRSVLGLLVGAGMWALTWVLPVTLMIVMAWSCESHTRQLFRRAINFYSEDPNAAGPRRPQLTLRDEDGHTVRRLVRTVAVALSIAIPIAFLVYAIHVRNTAGVNGVTGLGALVALSFVIAMVVLGSRR
jgi:hypothetical protein